MEEKTKPETEIEDIVDLMRKSRSVSHLIIGFYSKLRWEAPPSGLWNTSAGELSQILGLSPRTVSRYLSQLVDLNMINYIGTSTGCRIFIRKKGGMTNLAEGYDKFDNPMPKTPGGYDKFGKGGMTNLAEPTTEQTYSPKPEQAPSLVLPLEETNTTDLNLVTKSESPTSLVGDHASALEDQPAALGEPKPLLGGTPSSVTPTPQPTPPPKSNFREFASCPHTPVAISEYWNPLSWVEFKEKLQQDPQTLLFSKRRIWQQIETHYSPRDIKLELLHKANQMDWPLSYLISLFTVVDGIPRLAPDAKREKQIVYKQLKPLEPSKEPQEIRLAAIEKIRQLRITLCPESENVVLNGY